MYFKDDYHKKTALELMNLFGFDNLEEDKELGSFCYVASATYKFEDLQSVISPEGLDLDTLEQMILVYSPSEMSMIRFALQLFNQNIDDITIPEVFSSLDEENKKVVLDAIKFKFGIK